VRMCRVCCCNKRPAGKIELLQHAGNPRSVYLARAGAEVEMFKDCYYKQTRSIMSVHDLRVMRRREIGDTGAAGGGRWHSECSASA
jgi:hypothetical protein